MENSFHCVVTQPLNYFSVWLKSLDRFSVHPINLFPTAAQALGFVTTLAYSWVSDALGGKRWQVMIVPAVCLPFLFFLFDVRYFES